MLLFYLGEAYVDTTHLGILFSLGQRPVERGAVYLVLSICPVRSRPVLLLHSPSPYCLGTYRFGVYGTASLYRSHSPPPPIPSGLCRSSNQACLVGCRSRLTLNRSSKAPWVA